MHSGFSRIVACIRTSFLSAAPSMCPITPCHAVHTVHIKNPPNEIMNVISTGVPLSNKLGQFTLIAVFLFYVGLFLC